MKKLELFFLGLTVVVTVLAETFVVPTAEELESLAAKGQHQEVIMRMKQIPVEQRSKNWVEILSKSAVAYLDALGVEAMAGAESAAIDILKTYPDLKRSKIFMSKRTQVALSSIERCYVTAEKDDSCSPRALEFVSAIPDDFDTIMDAAELTKKSVGLSSALPIFEVAFGGKKVISVCRHKSIQTAVFEAFAHPDESLSNTVSGWLTNHCWKQFRNSLMNKIDTSSDDRFLKRVCPLLSSREKLSSGRSKKCRVK